MNNKKNNDIFFIMTFVPTKAEIEILLLLHASSMTKEELINKFGDKIPAENAIQGCLAKGFVSKKDDKIFLTESGKKQI